GGGAACRDAGRIALEDGQPAEREKLRRDEADARLAGGGVDQVGALLDAGQARKERGELAALLLVLAPQRGSGRGDEEALDHRADHVDVDGELGDQDGTPRLLALAYSQQIVLERPDGDRRPRPEADLAEDVLQLARHR